MSDSRCHAHINLTEQHSACVPCLLAHVAALEQKLAAWEPVVRAALRLVETTNDVAWERVADKVESLADTIPPECRPEVTP